MGGKCALAFVIRRRRRSRTIRLVGSVRRRACGRPSGVHTHIYILLSVLRDVHAISAKPSSRSSRRTNGGHVRANEKGVSRPSSALCGHPKDAKRMAGEFGMYAVAR